MAARRAYNTTAYRYPRERLILALTLLLVLLIIALTATATLCGSLLVVVVMVVYAYARNRSHHRALMERARPVTEQSAPVLAAIAAESVARLQVNQVQVFIAPGNSLNAYTFGLVSPKVVVLHSSLLQVLDADELRFVLGHELGHVRLGHTWLNSLVGGMAGMPSPSMASVVLALAFLWWNRACEYSADRAGLLACGKPHKAISALVKLAAGTGALTRTGLERALRHIEAENDHALSTFENGHSDGALAGLSESLSTHPMTVRRIEQLRRYASTDGYRHLQSLMTRNAEA